MKRISQSFLVAATVLMGIIVIVLAVFAFRQGFSKRPSLDETAAIRSTIRGFTRAKTIEERSDYTTGSRRIQRDLRLYVLIPFEQREILSQKISVEDIGRNQKTGRKEAQVEQELEYQSGSERKTTRLRVEYQLEKDDKWLINDYNARVIKK